jgi:betaine-aldehyde dehydrogenase
VIGQITEPTHVEIERVIATANSAQKLWNSMSSLDRAKRLHEVAATIRGDLRAEIAELMTRETEKLFKESVDELLWAASVVDYYAEVGRHRIGSALGSTVPVQMHYSVKEPMGTVGLVLPANFPICLMMWSAGAALAAGNAVIVKPSEYAALTTLSFMRAFAYLPEGVVQCVPGGAAVGKQLVAHQDTHLVVFTGSVPSGQAVTKACANTLKPHLIEALRGATRLV